ncbi:uncharacterized protein LOC123298934 [Chrysoperla carnea]|uniref:uncharacterized protein LOC123298934 n=1 Tax=Chrysoperla carnea TaxID=189513 RepID=UPI001D098ED4|nr:uncharacterized protein LOC123298934 [Chrysoperla carnea]
MDDIIIEKSLPINYMRSPPVGRRQQTYIVNNNNGDLSLNLSPHDHKKRESKKWSFGGFFRRRKKSIESDSSSQDEKGGGFMSRKKKSSKKSSSTTSKSKKKLGLGSTFDHIVIHPKEYHGDTGIMSDPSINYNDYTSPAAVVARRNDHNLLHNHQNIFINLHKQPNGSVETSKSSHESLAKQSVTPSSQAGSYGSLDSSTKKRHRERARQRRADRIHNNNNESSSDEGSQRSTASSLIRIKSDSDSATKLSRSTVDGSINRKTRSARTERYIKRLSREDENILNKEAEIVKNRQRSVSTSPIVTQHSTVSSRPKIHLPSTISSSSQMKTSHRKPPIFGSNGSHNDLYSKSLRNGVGDDLESPPILPVQRTTPDSYYMPKQKSWSFENNIHRGISPTMHSDQYFNYYTPPNYHQHPTSAPGPGPRPVNPPTPPPRDPQRRVISLENTTTFPRPMSYAFENNNQRNSLAASTNAQKHPNPNGVVDRTSSMRSINGICNIPQQRIIDRRANSDDHIQETSGPKRYITRQPRINPNDQVKYQFFTDQIPRSRKPIHIVQNDILHNQYLSDSQVEQHRNGYESRSPSIQSVAQFWKQKELEEVQRRQENKQIQKSKLPSKNHLKSETSSPATSVHSNSPVGATTNRQNSPSSPFDSLKRRDSNSFRPLSMVLEKPENHNPPKPPTRRSSRQSSASSSEMIDWINEDKPKVTESPIPAPRISLQNNETIPKTTRKSTNLEDALNELEEIYKSLHLGDEDLLDRAERRDIPTFTGKTPELNSRLSSSTESFNEDMPTNRVKRSSRRSGVPDKITDDMAYRKLRKNDLSPSYSSPKDSILSQVSYLLASPDLSAEPEPLDQTDNPFDEKEPDITLDDVVYRNLKHTNNQLKVMERQPPFGIPVGPVTAAPNSDYLHAKPEQRIRSRFIPQKIPDIVKDDLAFRSLRKDQIKDPLLPDDYRNNNAPSTNHLDVRKKRAVRSLSANLYNIIQRDRSSFNPSVEMEKTNSLTNVIGKDAVNPSLRITNEIPTSTETLTASRNNLVNSDSELNIQHRLRVYIPRTANQESDTDIEITINKTSSPRKISLQNTPTRAKSPVVTTINSELSELNKSELETLLINLAKETQEESKKLEIELEKFERTPKDHVSEHAKLCEKLLECVVESTDVISSSRLTSDNEEAADDRKIEELKKIDTISNMLTDIDSTQICKDLLECSRNPEKIDNNNRLQDIDNASSQVQMCGEILQRAIENIPDNTNQNRLNAIDNVSSQVQICGNILERTVENTPTKNITDRLNEIDDVSSQVKICGNILERTVEDIPENMKQNRLNDIDNVSTQVKICGNILERTVENKPDRLINNDKVENLENISNNQENVPIRKDTTNLTQLCDKIVECVVQSTEIIPIKPEKVELPPSDEDDEEITTQKIALAAIELATNIDNEMVEDFDNKCPELESTIANVILVRKPDSPLDLMYIDSDRLSIVKSDDYENLDDLIASPTFSDGNDMDEEKSLFETEKQNIVDNFVAINQSDDQPKISMDSTSTASKNETQTKGSTRLNNNYKLLSRTRSTSSSTIRPQCSNDTNQNQNECTSSSGTTSLWYKDSKIMALACAYAFACTHQLAAQDLITILGIILAVISLLFALIV